ncbi:MAG: DNA polymerase III subunit beta [Parachlamydiaceae bacterium]|nr:DNA polymerase III subunit beta [Parachlamydiaceae bacterium]
MKFVISTQELIYLVSKCLNIVGLKTISPILSNILIEAAHDELSVTTTDLTVGIRCFADAKILVEGATTLPARKLAQLLKELTAANLEFSTSANEVTEILADSSRFKMNGMNREEFPSLPEFKDAFHFTVEQPLLREMLYCTSFAVSREDNRYTLTGVNLSIANRIATFSGTDGKRLAKSHMEVDIDPAFQGSFIIPLKAVDEIQKNLMDEGSATVYLMKDKIAVEAGQTTLITKLLSGEYPDIERIIPQNVEFSISLHREELMTLLRQIALFTSDTNSVRFTFTHGTLQLNANTAEVGEGKVSMPVNYHGDKLEIAFNPGFFLDILRHSKGESITLGVTDGYNPGRITEENSTAIFVLMPMRLNEE